MLSPSDDDRPPGRRGPRTLVDRVWDAHLVGRDADGRDLLVVDRSLLHDRQTPVLEGLSRAGRAVDRPERVVAVVDQRVPTTIADAAIDAALGPVADEEPTSELLTALEAVADVEAATSAAEIPVFGPGDPRRGVLHVVVPEQGMTHPGMLVVGADAHTSTHGAFGALALAITDHELGEVLATSRVARHRPPNLRLALGAALGPYASAKDLALWALSRLGPRASAGHIVELVGPAVGALSMPGRMTLCNLAIEAGAVTAVIAPDATTFADLEGRPFAPSGAEWSAAVATWRTLRSEPGSSPDVDISLIGGQIEPHVTWGTAPWQAAPISARVPAPSTDPSRRSLDEAALTAQGLRPGDALEGLAVDRVFIGSCANARIDDLRAAAEIARGGRAQVPVIVVPGSGPVKRAAEAEGLHHVFRAAGFEWREPGCSLCVGANGDHADRGERVASTANRSVLGIGGRGVRTHLMSPAMAAAAGITGRLTDVRRGR
ncbi:MAG TPA: aconitase family protein [Acidimicrobiales bacterium]|nr:aconitase family protein [Acidimicrobiales bacterium]